MNKPVVKFVAIALIAAALFTLAALLPVPVVNSQSPERLPLTPGIVRAQLPRVSDRSAQVWQRVYEQMPDFPREDQYVDKVTGAVAQNSTLASRLIHYHMFVKSRAPNYRLDWKLTLADYLDANEWMSPPVYPGADTLQPNPITGDKAAIGHLSRAQRDRLVTVLVSTFLSDSASDRSAEGTGVNATPVDAIPSQPSPMPSPSRSAPAPIQTQPGAAQLLLP